MARRRRSSRSKNSSTGEDPHKRSAVREKVNVDALTSRVSMEKGIVDTSILPSLREVFSGVYMVRWVITMLSVSVASYVVLDFVLRGYEENFESMRVHMEQQAVGIANNGDAVEQMNRDISSRVDALSSTFNIRVDTLSQQINENTKAVNEKYVDLLHTLRRIEQQGLYPDRIPVP